MKFSKNIARNKPYFSFQLSLPFGPPAVLRVEVAVSVNGIGINAKNIPYTAHPEKEHLHDESRAYCYKEISYQSSLCPSRIRHRSPFRRAGSDKRQLVSACSVIEIQDYCKPIFLEKESNYCQRLTLRMTNDKHQQDKTVQDNFKLNLMSKPYWSLLTHNSRHKLFPKLCLQKQRMNQMACVSEKV